jgi:hypothetical protein
MDFSNLNANYEGSSKRKALFFLARTAERAERWDNMAGFMTELVRTTGGKDLSPEELDSLSIAFKKVIGPVKMAYARLNVEDDEDPNSAKFEAVTLTYKKQLEQEIQERCNEALAIFEGILCKNKGEPVQSRVYFLQMTADYYRFLAELGDKTAFEKSRQYYEDALTLAESELQPPHPARLGVSLNFSVYLYQLVRDPKQACSLAKSAFDKAISKLDDLDEASYKDSTLIMQLLRDNLTLWTSEGRSSRK